MEFELFRNVEHEFGYIRIGVANKIFRDWLAKGDVVYGRFNPLFIRNGKKTPMDFGAARDPQRTHKAILVCVEEIEKEKPPVGVQEIKVLGLSAEQIGVCKSFYESKTGNPAEDIGREKDSAEQVLKDLIDQQPNWENKSGKLILLDEEHFSEIIERAKKILEKDEYEERDRQRK